jgi:voltage-gated sodium channel
MYFVSFVVFGTFVVINLFIAVVINNLDEAKQERLRQLEQAPTADSLLSELRATQQSLRRLEEQLRRSREGDDGD